MQHDYTDAWKLYPHTLGGLEELLSSSDRDGWIQCDLSLMNDGVCSTWAVHVLDYHQ